MGILATTRASPNMQHLLIPFLLAPVLSGPFSQGLSPSWIQMCKGTYLFSEDQKSWDEANDYCELYGGHLAKIDSLEENFCLLEHIMSEQVTGEVFWHSANDIEVEGVMRQGRTGPFISWMPKFWSGEYQNGGGEGRDSNCFYLIGKSGTSQYAGMWDDIPCSHLHNFICES